eukprot:2547984-Pyramimonas_sp.AAC.1
MRAHQIPTAIEFGPLYRKEGVLEARMGPAVLLPPPLDVDTGIPARAGDPRVGRCTHAEAMGPFELDVHAGACETTCGP